MTELAPGQLVIVRVRPSRIRRLGRVCRVQRNGLVSVEMYSFRLRRFARGQVTYAASFLSDFEWPVY